MTTIRTLPIWDEWLFKNVCWHKNNFKETTLPNNLCFLSSVTNKRFVIKLSTIKIQRGCVIAYNMSKIFCNFLLWKKAAKWKCQVYFTFTNLLEAYLIVYVWRMSISFLHTYFVASTTWTVNMYSYTYMVICTSCGVFKGGIYN